VVLAQLPLHYMRVMQLCCLMVAWGARQEVQETKSQTFIFAIQFLRPRQIGAHDTCHACHTLDTPQFNRMNSGRTLFFKASASCSKFLNVKSEIFEGKLCLQGERKLLKS